MSKHYGYMKEPRSAVPKGQRHLLALIEHNGEVLLPIAALLRFLCPNDSPATLQKYYNEMCAKHPENFEHCTLDFADNHYKQPGDTVLCSNCARECAPNARCGPCARRADMHFFYCSQACQLAAWPEHRRRCRKGR